MLSKPFAVPVAVGLVLATIVATMWQAPWAWAAHLTEAMFPQGLPVKRGVEFGGRVFLVGLIGVGAAWMGASAAIGRHRWLLLIMLLFLTWTLSGSLAFAGYLWEPFSALFAAALCFAAALLLSVPRLPSKS